MPGQAAYREVADRLDFQEVDEMLDVCPMADLSFCAGPNTVRS
jgi:hypothetical protein